MSPLRFLPLMLLALVPAGCGEKPTPPQPGSAGQASADIVKAKEFVGRLGGTAAREKDSSGVEVFKVMINKPTQDEQLPELRRVLSEVPLPVVLNLNYNEELSDAGLAHFKGWKNLHAFNTDSKRITDKGMENLADLPALMELYLANENLTDAGLVPVGKLTTLRRLTIHGKKLTPAGSAHLSGLTNLEEFSFYPGDANDADDIILANMAGMKNLRKLRPLGNVSDAGLAYLKNFPELRDLEISLSDSTQNRVTGKGLANLAHLKKLETLSVNQCHAMNDGMAALKALSELSSLELIYCAQIPPEGIRNLAGLTKLRRLRLEWPTKEALKEFKDLKALEVLVLENDQNRDDASLKLLTFPPGLKEIHLGRTGITDAGIGHLKGATTLEKVWLRDTRVTPAGVAELKKALPQAEIKD